MRVGPSRRLNGSRRAWHPMAPLAMLALVVLAATGCQVRLAAEVVVGRDGSGVVRAAVGLDDEALAELGDPAERLQIEDLRQAGWHVDGPAREADGLTWVRVSKPFSTPGEGGRLAAQLSGPEGPFRGIEIGRTQSPWSTTTTFSGAIDLAEGLAGMLDADAAALLGDDLGLGLDELRGRFGESLGDVVRVDLSASLPGERRTWQAVLGEEQLVSLSARHWNLGIVLPAIATVLFGAAALLVVARRQR